MGVGRSDGGCRVSSAGGVCLRRDWGAVDQQGVGVKREERGRMRCDEWRMRDMAWFSASGLRAVSGC